MCAAAFHLDARAPGLHYITDRRAMPAAMAISATTPTPSRTLVPRFISASMVVSVGAAARRRCEVSKAVGPGRGTTLPSGRCLCPLVG